MPGHAFIGKDLQQAQLAFTAEAAGVFAIACGGNAIPGKKGQFDVGDFHAICLRMSGSLCRLEHNLTRFSSPNGWQSKGPQSRTPLPRHWTFTYKKVESRQ